MTDQTSPRFVMVPQNLTIDQVSRAIEICMGLGLLKDEPHGWVIVPKGSFVKVRNNPEPEDA